MSKIKEYIENLSEKLGKPFEDITNKDIKNSFKRKTFVKFLIDNGEVFAYFPYLNYNKLWYGNTTKSSYSHVGQHGSCITSYAAGCRPASKDEYYDLKNELENIGYNLKLSKENL